MEYTKSRMSGMVSDYQKMYDAIKNWNEESPPTKRLEDGTFYNEPGHYIYGMGWALGDMCFHGWVGDAAKNEMYHYELNKLKRNIEEKICGYIFANWYYYH